VGKNYSSLSREYSVSKAQQDSYRQDGHILLRNVCPREDIEIFRPLMLNIVGRAVASKDTQGGKAGYGAMFTRVSNIWERSGLTRQFVFARRFAKIAADLMGVKGVRLYHDQALVKEPGGKPTTWHQDQVYWPLDTPNTITMWMPLVDVPKTMGTMTFASRSHSQGFAGMLPISDAADSMLANLIKEKKYETASYDLNAGDATFHSGLTIHSAHENSSDKRREVMTIIYYEDGAKILEPDSEFRRMDMNAFHPGQSPGEVAASPLNPLLYP
jgi:ectoine hydroxylase-related dioxygenase (phytanoyl-CoA dioxygenase family)